MDYYTQKIIKMLFPPLLSLTQKLPLKLSFRQVVSRNPVPYEKPLDSRLTDCGNDKGEYIYLKNRGFTIIELVITMVLIGIVAFIVADAMSTGFKTYFITDNRKEALDQARIAVERMTREIRNVRSSSDVDTVSSSTTQFCFINTDGTVISFRYNANAIAREDTLANLAACPGAAGNTLSTNITTFSFGYVRGDNGVVENTFSAANTKRIRIIITSTVSGEPVTLQSDVWPRSL